jgi:ribosomal protein S13
VARRRNTEPKIARELAIALLHAVVENRERAVALLVWAGADVRKPVPDLRYAREDDIEEDDLFSTPIVHALLYGHSHLLGMLKPNPAADDYDALWTWACDEAAVDYLAKRKVSTDWSKVMIRNLERALSSYRGDVARKVVEKLTLEHDARVTTMSEAEIVAFRREILRCQDDSRCRWVLRWLSYPETCEPHVFRELTRTASVQRKVNSLHIRDARYRY